MKKLTILLLLLAPLTVRAQSGTNCSTGSWVLYDSKGGPGCPTIAPQTLWVSAITDTVTANEWCTASNGAAMAPGTQYWTATPPSTDTGNGERWCPIGQVTGYDCWPRMWFYEVDGGQKYPNGTTSDTYSNRFFNQGYDHKVDVINDVCFEVPKNGQYSSQDFKQCVTQACLPPPPPPRCCRCPGPYSSKEEQKLLFRNVGQGGVCQQGYSTECCGSTPIIIDTSGQGFNLTSAAAGVTFDISGKDNPIQIGWTAANSGDGFLCLPDANGACDDGRDLFGSHSPQPASSTPNGFAALAVYDTAIAGGNGDGVIDSKDPIFNRLRLWIDANHDGKSQPNEIFTLPQLGISSLSLDYHSDTKTDQYGNVFRYRAKITTTSGTNHWAYDVFFTTLAGTLSACSPSGILPAAKVGLSPQ